MVKKKIVLGGIWPRIGAHGIDLGCILALALPIYFAFILPASLDLNKYSQNSRKIRDEQIGSGLYFDFTENICATLYYNNNVDSLSKLTTSTVQVDNKVSTVHILDGIHTYYTQTRGNYYTDRNCLEEKVFLEDVIKVNNPLSNIKDFFIPSGESHYVITLIDNANATAAIKYIKAVFNAAATELNACPAIKKLDNENTSMQLFAVLMLIPTVSTSAFIFTGLIPLFSPYGKSIGKYALHLIVLNGSGYEIKRWQIIPRSLSYIALELVGGVLSFGATILISYTMTMFMKKHRSFHDFIAYTVVADEKRSFWFKDRLDEEEWLSEHQNEIEAE